jgi:hypothetical protein
MITRRSRILVTTTAIIAGLLTVLEPDTAAQAALRGGGVQRANFSANRNLNVNGNFNRNINRNANINRNINRNVNVNVNRNINRNVVRTGAWVRPGYRWRPGGAIAAGAAIGFVTAATAVVWAGAAPGPNLCWYYTDSSRQQGFWDACP